MKRTALVVDDDILCLEIMTEYLIDKDFDTISSLVPVCPLLERQCAHCPMQVPCCDVIFSDHHMPEMTGLEFFVYQEQHGCKVPACRKALISGNISGKTQQIAETHGYKIFHKPTSLDVIDSWLDNV